jgi:ethanolamine permease
LFIFINAVGIKESAAFSVFITLLAVAELLIFMGIIGPGFKMTNYLSHPMPFGWSGVFAALPFAVWFYLAIEGVAQVAEEVKDPKRNIPRGYIYGIVTLVLLALGVMILTGGVTDWRKLSALDYPLPAAISIVLGNGSSLTKIFTGIGLFGLIASFHGIILASSRQVFAMARSGYLPGFLSGVSHRFKTPHWALIGGGVVSICTLLLGLKYEHITDKVIVISVMGAVLMYMMSMLSLFILRRKEPTLERPFASPLYPYFPAVALVLSGLCLFAIIYFNFILSLYFFGGLATVVILFMLLGKHKKKITDDVLLVQAEVMISPE